MNASWQIDHQCPQCGGPVTLDETDRRFACPYCRVNFSLLANGVQQYYLPPAEEDLDDKLYYAPYWRFRGTIHSCLAYEITHQLLDATVLALDLGPMPPSLGFRPQVFKLRFVNPSAPGRFFTPQLKKEDALVQMEERLRKVESPGFRPGDTLFHRSFFGENVSLIYAPFRLTEKKALFDAVTHKYLGVEPDSFTAAPPPWLDKNKSFVSFIPALCPHCGWDLAGPKDAVVLVCSNCRTASAAAPQGLVPIKCSAWPEEGSADAYLPFWRLTADARGLPLKTFADLIKATNLPKVPRSDSAAKPLYFWTPAFKAHARLFLRLARNATASQPQGPLVAPPPEKPLLPVTVPAKDVAPGLKTLLADLSNAKSSLFPKLPQIDLTVTQARLVYFPFRLVGPDLTSERMHISLNQEIVGFSQTG